MKVNMNWLVMSSPCEITRQQDNSLSKSVMDECDHGEVVEQLGERIEESWSKGGR